MLSGAILDPSALRDLLPDFESRGAPLGPVVQDERVLFLTERRTFRFPITPPPLKNHGCHVISLSRFARWLAEQAEAEGVDVFTGFAATEVLYEGERIVGVRTGDRGVDRQGGRKPTFEQGVDIRATVTVLADGVRGNLTKTVLGRLRLAAASQPQSYALGIKELWEVPADRLAAGTVVHTLGYPLRAEEFGGGFIYALAPDRLSVGFVTGLDYRDPLFDPHAAFQRFKRHPAIAALLADGQMVRYGAKALPEGGWHALPRAYADGALVIGDAAGFPTRCGSRGFLWPCGPACTRPRWHSTRCRLAMPRPIASRRFGTRSTMGRSAGSCIRCATSIRPLDTACWPAWPMPGCRC